MMIKKYRFLLLITILFSSLNNCVSITDQERKLINKLAKETLLLYAMQQNISPENHLKTISGKLFGTSNTALVILTKKVMRHVCKHLYLQGLPRLSIYAKAIKKFQKYQRPTDALKTTNKKKKQTHSAHDIGMHFLKNHAGKIAATVIVGLVLTTLLASYQDLYEQMSSLRELVLIQVQQISALQATTITDKQGPPKAAPLGSPADAKK